MSIGDVFAVLRQQILYAGQCSQGHMQERRFVQMPASSIDR